LIEPGVVTLCYLPYRNTIL